MKTLTASVPASGRMGFFETTPSVLMPDPAGQLDAAKVDARPEAYRLLLADAETALVMPFRSVVDKDEVPASGDMHDYMSQGIYKWPDPEQPDGLPYVYRDGIINPEVEKFDSPRLFAMAEAAETLALAGWYSDDERFLQRAAACVRHWFLEPGTRVNPNWNCAQRHPGKHDGCGVGIIEAHVNLKFINAIRMLDARGALDAGEIVRLKVWFGEFADWLINSSHGKNEAAMTNNHSLWFYAQLGTYLYFADRTADAVWYLNLMLPRLTGAQIDTAGNLPGETERTQSYHYVSFSLTALMHLWRLAGALHVPMNARMRTALVRTRDALDRFLPYVRDDRSWPHQQIRPNNHVLFTWGAYMAAAHHFDYNAYADAVLCAAGEGYGALRHHLMI